MQHIFCSAWQFSFLTVVWGTDERIERHGQHHFPGQVWLSASGHAVLAGVGEGKMQECISGFFSIWCNNSMYLCLCRSNHLHIFTSEVILNGILWIKHSTKNGEKWGPPANMGYATNTDQDQAVISISCTSKKQEKMDKNFCHSSPFRVKKSGCKFIGWTYFYVLTNTKIRILSHFSFFSF